MGWIIGILIGIIILRSVIKIMSNEKGASTSTQSHPVAAAPAWREPVTPDEHFVLLSIMADALSAFDREFGYDQTTYIKLRVSYSWGPNQADRVAISLSGIDLTSMFDECAAMKYIKAHSSDGMTAEWKFEFAQSSGAPGYYRTNEAVLNFVQRYASSAFISGMSDSDITWLCFKKHDIRRQAENLDVNIVKSYGR